MKYTIKVWLFTIITSPLLIAFIFGFILYDSNTTSILNSYEIIFVMIIIGFLLSTPAMTVFWFIKRKLKNRFSHLIKKTILSVYGFLSVWTTFYLVDNGFITRRSEQTIWVLIYSIIMVAAIWIFKINTSPYNSSFMTKNKIH